MTRIQKALRAMPATEFAAMTTKEWNMLMRTGPAVPSARNGCSIDDLKIECRMEIEE